MMGQSQGPGWAWRAALCVSSQAQCLLGTWRAPGAEAGGGGWGCMGHCIPAPGGRVCRVDSAEEGPVEAAYWGVPMLAVLSSVCCWVCVHVCLYT